MSSQFPDLNLKYLSSRSQKTKEYETVELERLWRPVFDRYDIDNDGRIPLQELKSLLSSETDFKKDLPPDVIEEILEWADLNKDNYLSYSEFEHMMHAADLGAARPKFHRLVRYTALAIVPKSHRAIVTRYYIEHYNCIPPPIFLLLISIIELIVFIYYCVKLSEFSATGPIPVESALIYNPYRRYEAWRYITYMLIHAGAVHLFFNLLVQIILGVPLEMVHKWWRVGLVYMAGVLAGSLGASLSDPVTYLAGASGGVYALIAAHLANVVINWKEMEFRWYRLIAVLLLGGTDIGVALYNRYAMETKSRTSYAAHFAGALAGFLVGLNALRNLKIHSWETKLGWVMLGIYGVLMLFAIFWNIFYSDYFPKK